MTRWLRDLSIDPEAEVICEIGFGGGWCLPMLQSRGAFAMGLEPIDSNRANAARLGIHPDRLFDIDPLPVLPRKPTLWLFQDSFEHVEDPAALVQWMASESSPAGARILIVAPNGASWSRRIMGRFWVHNTPDHWIHYSVRGAAEIFARAGFRMGRSFNPLKCVTPVMIVEHIGLLLSHPGLAASLQVPRWPIWFNIGEMGLLLERNED